MKKLMAALGLGLGLTFSMGAATAAYPDRPVTIIVPFGPGSSTDLLTRSVAQGLSERIGQTVVVQNRAGAGGNVGSSTAARSEPDGYTLVMGTNGPFAANVALYSNLPYNPLKDFKPIALMGQLPMMLIANKNAPASTLQELISQAKAAPGTLNFGSSNTTSRVWVELLKDMGEIDVETILYKDVGTMLADLMGGQISYAFENVGPSLPLVKSGEVKALAVTAAERAAFAPEIPTLKESGLDEHELIVWFALFAPQSTPDGIVDYLNQEVNEVLKTEALASVAQQLGMRIVGGSSSDMATYHADEIEKWRRFVEMAGIEIN